MAKKIFPALVVPDIAGISTTFRAGARLRVALPEAIESCRARPPAFVILDLGLAEPDIAMVVAGLREAAPELPVIAYGSHVDKERLDAARAAGCNEVLPKSKFSAELPALLRCYFEGARL